MRVPSSQLGRELQRSAGHPFPPLLRACVKASQGEGLENAERELRFSLPALPPEPMGAAPVV